MQTVYDRFGNVQSGPLQADDSLIDSLKKVDQQIAASSAVPLMIAAGTIGLIVWAMMKKR
jgi:hypothetical protein